VLPAALAGERLDKLLVALWPGLSRTRAQALLERGAVRVGGTIERRASLRLAAGVRIELSLATDVPPTVAPPAAGSVQVLYEDEHLCAVNKPAGLPTHGSGLERSPSLADWASARYGSLPTLHGRDRPGIVHRLDRGTSGVLVLARTELALASLARQFQQRQVSKSYWALTWGEPRFDSGWIDAPLARAAPGTARQAVAAPGTGRKALTYYEVRERFGDAALLVCRPHTGRTHQLRVHLGALGHPLLGDRMYRKHGTHPERSLPGAPPLSRQALHAERIAFQHPATGLGLELSASLPEDLAALLAWLRSRP
jgi:23S rRNA pseudouridine1911/1915/1917 synthase